MANKPLVSVVMCTYNGEKYLAEQLDSIVNQTYPNIELIVVDDCSSDHTFDILNDYASRHPFFKVVANKINLGVNANFEKGMRMANGQFISISDQDDIWKPEKISTLMDQLGNKKMICSDSQCVDELGNLLDDHLFKKRVFKNGFDPRLFSYTNIVTGHTVLFAANYRERFLPIPQDCIYDWWMGFVAANDGQLSYCPSMLTFYRIHENNVSKQSGFIDASFELRWSKCMLHLEGLKHKPFFQSYYKSILKDGNKSVRFHTFLFVLANISSTYGFVDKSILSKLNNIRKLLF